MPRRNVKLLPRHHASCGLSLCTRPAKSCGVCILPCGVGTTCLQPPIRLPDTPPCLPRFGVDCLGSMPIVLSEVTMVGYPNLARPLRMPYLGVARGCACVAIHAECVELPAYCSVLDTRTTCVRFTKSRDTALKTGMRWEIATVIPHLSTDWFSTAFLVNFWP